METVCTLCHISLSAYHRASPNVGWPRFRAVLMLTATCVSDRVEWHESSERNPSRCASKISRPKDPQGTGREGAPANDRGGQVRNFSLMRAAFSGWHSCDLACAELEML